MYFAQVKLHMSPAQWDALSWDRKRCYVEGFEREGLISLAEPADAGEDLISGDLSALSGFSVRVVGAD